MKAEEFEKTEWLYYDTMDRYTFAEAYAKHLIESRVCVWNYDEPYEYYNTNCGESFAFINDGVEENGYKHCPNCGNKIKLMETWIRKLTEKETKLVYQLFIGKVADELGFSKTRDLMYEAKKEILTNKQD
jgi:DNA-directed RNA polymerase subunit RPC12/RpoP